MPGYPYPPAPRPVPVAPGGAPLAEFWQRLVAYLLDGLLLGVIVVVPTLALAAALFFALFDVSADAAPPTAGQILLFQLVIGVLALALPLSGSYVYHVPLMVRTGQTPGKKALRIRIVNAADGGPLDRRQARLRWVVHFLAGSFAPYFNYADGLWQLWDQPYRQCLHDKCATTIVVKVDR